MQHKLKTDGSIKAIYGLRQEVKLRRPMLGNRIPAGFPSPAQDYIETMLDLNEFLVQHPAATFYVRAEGYSMIGAGIYPDDIVIVDRALDSVSGNIIVAVYDGELALKRLRIENDEYFLCPENPEFQPIKVNQELEFSIWGVVTYVIHKA